VERQFGPNRPTWDARLEGHWLFHVLASFNPLPSPGIFKSICSKYVLPVARLIGLPQAGHPPPPGGGGGAHFVFGIVQIERNTKSPQPTQFQPIGTGPENEITNEVLQLLLGWASVAPPKPHCKTTKASSIATDVFMTASYFANGSDVSEKPEYGNNEFD